MEAQDDISLLKSIVERRDCVAYDELFKRYQQCAFNAAYHILGSSALAEDAVQEAMLSIWLSRKTEYPADIRAWIVGIVVKRSLTLGRSRKRSTKRYGDWVAMKEHSSHDAADKNLEEMDLIAALRCQIETLPELERQILTCCYGASMPHRKIASTLGIPDRTVTDKIHQIIARLRLNLTKAGVAAVVPLISEKILCHAVTTGRECPPGMFERMTKLRENYPGGNAQVVSRRTGPFRSGGWILPASAVVVIAAAIGGTLWVKGSTYQTTQVDSSQFARNANQPIHVRWTFDKGPANDLGILQNNWKWESKNGTGQMVAPADALVSIGLPVEIPACPVVVNVKSNKDSDGPFLLGGFWMKSRKTLFPSRKWAVGYDTQASPMKLNLSYYFIGSHVIYELNHKIYGICEYPSPYPAKDIVMLIQGMNIEEIELRSLLPEELPSELRDIPQRIKDLGVEPMTSIDSNTEAKVHGK